jgi:hypothetical protein
MVVALAICFFTMWAGVALLVDAWGRRREPLVERLLRHQVRQTVWDAQDWLRCQQKRDGKCPLPED